ncbi:MAG: hypothetical protein ACRDRJ_19650 [Streptosporangiaceae bacterium]
MISRSDLGRLVPLDGPVPAKTFVIEVHADDPSAYLDELAPHSVEPTDDAYLWRVAVPGTGEFLADGLDQRFWSFHTTIPSDQAGAWLRSRVESRPDTDWMWLPSAHLRHIAPTAHSIEVVMDDPELGPLREAVKRSGLFAAHGEDFVHHAQFVRAVVGRYARLIDAIESQALRFSSLPYREATDQGLSLEVDDPDGATFSGAPIGIRFSPQITDLAAFCEELFSARAPWRLWGQPEITDGTALVDAVDLHVGQRLRMEVGSEWMRVYLAAGACGNTVARLVSNLQARFDSALSLSQPGLAISAKSDASDLYGDDAEGFLFRRIDQADTGQLI